MTEETIVAVFDTAAHADAAVRDLEAANLPSGAITRHSSGMQETTTEMGSGIDQGARLGMESQREPGFWSSLFGGETDHDTAVYDRSVDGGSTVVTVRVAEDQAAHVTSILERHNPVDMDERAASYGLGNGGIAGAGTGAVDEDRATAGYGRSVGDTGALRDTGAMRDTGAAGGEQRLQLAEEQLSVGKRLINRGTTRIRRFVVETPVEENVTLHSERVSVDRRPVSADTPVTDADFTDRTIEFAESDEEAVVGKTARVREEVVIRKDAADRVETVRDTVRRQDVEITKDGVVETDTGRTAGASRTP